MKNLEEELESELFDRSGRSPELNANGRLALQRAEEILALYDGLTEAGFVLGPQVGPVVAVFVDQPDLAINWWHDLLETGVYVNLVIPPATPGNKSLLRCSLSAAHSSEQIARIVDAFAALSPGRKVAGSTA